MAIASFTVSGDRFYPTALSRSGWGKDLVAGGPAGGLLARQIERYAAAPEWQLVRLTVHLFHPIPLVPLEVPVQTVRRGGRIHLVEASLFAGGREVTHAAAQFLRRSDGDRAEEPSGPTPPSPEDLKPILRAPTDVPRSDGFWRGFEVRRGRLPSDPSQNAIWMRFVKPLVEGEEWTPICRAAAMCDSLTGANNIGRTGSYRAINTDITLYMHRDPRGEWLCMVGARVQTPPGIGVARGRLFDGDGQFGVTEQASLRNDVRFVD